MKSFKKFVESRDRNLNEMARFYAADVDAADIKKFENGINNALKYIIWLKNFINQVVDTENKTILNMTYGEYTLHKEEFNQKATSEKTGIYLWDDKFNHQNHLNSIDARSVEEELKSSQNENALGTAGVTTLLDVVKCLSMIKEFYIKLSLYYKIL